MKCDLATTSVSRATQRRFRVGCTFEVGFDVCKLHFGVTKLILVTNGVFGLRNRQEVSLQSVFARVRSTLRVRSQT